MSHSAAAVESLCVRLYQQVFVGWCPGSLGEDLRVAHRVEHCGFELFVGEVGLQILFPARGQGLWLGDRPSVQEQVPFGFGVGHFVQVYRDVGEWVAVEGQFSVQEHGMAATDDHVAAMQVAVDQPERTRLQSCRGAVEYRERVAGVPQPLEQSAVLVAAGPVSVSRGVPQPARELVRVVKSIGAAGKGGTRDVS